MNKFDEQLLRLKNAVKVTSDRDVADLFGMSKGALSERKKRDAFPEDKLWALATQRPELKLDVDYILTGIDGRTVAVLEAKTSRMSRAADAGLDFDQIRTLEKAQDPASIEAITALLRECRVVERQAVFDLLSSITRLREALYEARADLGIQTR